MKKLAVLITLPLLAGCISWNQQASLTTKFTNASNSIQDLELSFPNLDAKEIIDSDTDQSVKFFYQGEADTSNLRKVTSTKKPNFAYKEVINLYYQNGQITLANLEIHELEDGYTNLTNHSFSIQNNKVDKFYTKGVLQTQPDQATENTIVSQVNSHIEYINSTYLSL